MVPSRRRTARSSSARGSSAYLAHVVPGLEDIASDELRGIGARPGRAWTGFDDRTSVLAFTYPGPPRDLLDLGVTEDVFALLVRHPVAPGKEGLETIRNALLSAPSHPVDIASQARARRRNTFRVVARKSGEHEFRRVDAQRAVSDGLRARFPEWRLVEEDARLEAWVHVMGAECVVGLRLSDGTMRHRTWLGETLPASLKPTVARAMVLLSEPGDGDVLCDPTCGAGTILLERAHAGRYRALVGGDADARAVETAVANVGRLYRPIAVSRWDAARLPLADASVTAVVANLPFGKQIGSGASNRALYPALGREVARVLRPGGRAVLLTSDGALLEKSLPGLEIRRRVPVSVRGTRATICLASS